MPHFSKLTVVGNQLVNVQGEVVVLRGTNNIGTHYSCLTNQYPYDPVFGGVPYDLLGIQTMKSWGMNCLRITVNAGCWLNCCVSPYTYGATYISALQSYITLLNANQMYVILNLVNTASGIGEMADTSAVTFWTSAATLFANNPGVLFELYNEPHGNGSNPNLSWSTWLSGGTNSGALTYTSVGMQTLLNTVRTTGAANICFLDGVSYAGDFTGWLAHLPTDGTLATPQLAASWHRYSDNPHTSITDIGGTFTDAVRNVATSYPVTLTEFGGIGSGSPILPLLAFNQAYYLQLLDFCDSIGAGYLNWAWNAGPGIGILSDYATYTPSEYGTAYRWHLMQMAAGDTAADRAMTRRHVIPTTTY